MELQDHIDQILQGHVELFEQIVQKHQRSISTFCYFMLGDRQEAEDATQEVFFKAYRSLGKYRHDSEALFKSWLYKIASNYCSSLLRRKKMWQLLMPLIRNEESEKSAEQIFSEQFDPHLPWMKVLSPGEKEMLALRVIEDKPFDEISQILGISPAAGRKRYERLKNKLNKNRTQWEAWKYEQRTES